MAKLLLKFASTLPSTNVFVRLYNGMPIVYAKDVQNATMMHEIHDCDEAKRLLQLFGGYDEHGNCVVPTQLRELVATKCDVSGYNPRSTDWVVVREDDEDFAKLSAMDRYKNAIRISPAYRRREDFRSCTRRDASGPCW